MFPYSSYLSQQIQYHYRISIILTLVSLICSNNFTTPHTSPAFQSHSPPTAFFNILGFLYFYHAVSQHYHFIFSYLSNIIAESSQKYIYKKPKNQQHHMSSQPNNDWLPKSSYTPSSSNNLYRKGSYQAGSYDSTRDNNIYPKNGYDFQVNRTTAAGETRYGGATNGDNFNNSGYNSYVENSYRDVKRLPEQYSSLRQTFNIGGNTRIKDMISRLQNDEIEKKYQTKSYNTEQNLYSSKVEPGRKYRDAQLEQNLKKTSISLQQQLNSQLENTSKVSQEIKKLRQQRKKRLEDKQREKNNEQNALLSSSYSLGSLTSSLKISSGGKDKFSAKDYGIDNKYQDVGSAGISSNAFTKKKRQEYQPYTPKYEKKYTYDFSSSQPSSPPINLDKYKSKDEKQREKEKERERERERERQRQRQKQKAQLFSSATGVPSSSLASFSYKPAVEVVSPTYKAPTSSTSSNYNSTNYSTKSVSSPSNKKIETIKFVEINGFILGKSLGQGKFGVVYQAFHKATGWLYAIKKVPKQMIKSHLMQDQFILELKLQTFLNHENILSIYSTFQDKTSIYLVLQYMQQGTLFSQLKKKKTLPQEDVAIKIRQIASALRYMHQNLIAHRDIKPENIVMSHGVCKLCDFGWATICDDRRKTYCGTFDYASPQILEGVEYDEKVDLWCLGILTYELLVGKAPFYHISRKQTMKKILNVQNTAIEYPDNLSQNAISFMDSLIRKDPKDRLNSDQLLEHPFLKNAEKTNTNKYH